MMVGLEKANKWLQEYNGAHIYLTEEICGFYNDAQEIIAREKFIVQQESGVSIPSVEIFFVDDMDIDAFATEIEGTNIIFINRGVIETYRYYLQQCDYQWLHGSKDEFINELVKTAYIFAVMHEYAHFFCGHRSADIKEMIYQQAMEQEADMFAMDYLIRKTILTSTSIEEIEDNIRKVFTAVYFFLDSASKTIEASEYHNPKLLSNYYDPDRISKRNHPLTIQRMGYLFRMMNIVYGNDKLIQLDKSNLLNYIASMKGICDDQRIELKGMNKILYENWEESMDKLSQCTSELRTIIPRLFDYGALNKN